VRIERVVRTPQVLGLVPGSTVTLRSANGPPAKGERALFVTDPWLYAEGVAVIERGRVPVEGDSPEEMRSMEEELAAIELAPLRARVRDADAVVVGSVVRLGPLDRKQTPDSEHDAMWWEAEITVEETLKGEAKRTIRLVFPTSTDVVWYGWPRPAPNQRAVFVLRTAEHRDVRGAFCAPHPLDIQPVAAAERIRELVGRAPRG
jgi:hypothetical protein